jgi:hypothetical protein
MLFEKDGHEGDMDEVEEEDEDDLHDSDYFDEGDMNEDAKVAQDQYLQD